jgi:hypothetical protein
METGGTVVVVVVVVVVGVATGTGTDVLGADRVVVGAMTTVWAWGNGRNEFVPDSELES